MQPVTNLLIWLSHYLLSSFGLAIIAATVIVNLALYPINMKQTRSTKAMQGMQPKLAELQKKYAKDKQKLAQEQMKLYKESGLSPTGCLVPMLIQMPVWIALFYSIRTLLGDTPETFIRLSQLLYNSQVIHTTLPLVSDFLWFSLAAPDTTMILPLLVGGSMWVQQKMSTVPSADPKQRQQSQMMLWMMPMMFFLFSMQFPSGLALFWAVSTMLRIVLQYRVSGWGGLRPQRAPATAAAGAVIEGKGKFISAPKSDITAADINAGDGGKLGGKLGGKKGGKPRK